MKKVLFFIYSIVAYLIGFASIMYWILSVSNLIPEISIDQSPKVSLGFGLLKNAGLISLFGLQHSVMARKSFKDAFAKYFPKPIERSTFVFVSGLLLFLMVNQWEPIGGIIWEVNSDSMFYYIIYSLFFIGWVILFVSTFIINHFDLFGLRQTFLELQNKPYTRLEFRIKSFYKYVRHPLYFGMLLGMWATPVMSVTHLVFAIGITAYVIIGTRYEERDLVEEFGPQYELYQKRKPMLIPFTKRKQKGLRYGKAKTMFFFTLLTLISIEAISQTITIPDTNFEQALIDLGYDNNGLTGNITQNDAEAVSHLVVGNQNISSLQGIEGFTNLQNLFCENNQLSTLDVSGLSNLQILNCGNNTIASLDLSLNTNLTELRCFNNQLTSIEVSDLSNLQLLNCNNNNITSLDLSLNTNLTKLRCNNNQLASLDLGDLLNLQELSCGDNTITSLDVSINSALDSLFCDGNQLATLNVKNGNNTNFIFFSALNNPNLSCIEVDDVAYSTANWDSIDSQSFFSMDCLPLISIPDANFEQALIDLGYDTNGLTGNITQDDADAVTTLFVSNENISSLEGIEGFANLQNLFCAGNQLATLDVSDLLNLEDLDCGSNNLTSLDLSFNTNLESLECGNNQLTDLDISSNLQLRNFNCSGNQLTILDLSANTQLEFLTCSANNLEQLDVSDLTILSNLNCNENQISTLDLSNNTALNVLSSESNQLAQLNLSNNSLLREVYCSINQLTTLDVSNLVNLRELHCNENEITELVLSNNTELRILNCEVNQLEQLDLSGSLLLNQIYCSDNQLTALDLSNNTSLEAIDCSTNNLTQLDLSTNSALVYFIGDSNQLSTLNVENGNNINFVGFSTLNNPDLFCIRVDDEQYSTANWTNIDAQTNFSKDCETLCVEDIDLTNFSLYPNPASDNFFIKGLQEEATLAIYDLNGRQIQRQTINSNQDVSVREIPSGLYVVKIENNSGTTTKKLIVR